MKCSHVVALASLSWLTLGMASPAAAQFPTTRPPNPPPLTPPAPRPAVSPYLNLLRGGDPTLNYQGLVRPQTEFRSNINQLNQQLQTSQQAITNLEVDSGLPATGHPTQFLNLGGYFLSKGGRGASGGTGTAAPPAATPARRPPVSSSTPPRSHTGPR